MSILINGIKMPNREEYFININIRYDGKVKICKSNTQDGLFHDTEATAIELPKHGRLIDADALIEAVPPTNVDIFENCRRCELLDQEQVIDLINDAPTIIEADKDINVLNKAEVEDG